MKLDRTEAVFVIVTLLIINLLCMWCLDVSTSAMLSGGVLVNAYMISNPVVMYHLSLYVVLGISVLLVFICIYYIMKGVGKE